ncbi:MAG TPA: hypothetical protein VFN91_06315, partial [Myxococcaceae bacterium]|nr:hypothetical protein [Myxococcaceae bacterium]
EERLQSFATRLLPGSSGMEEAQGRAAASLVGDLVRQAYTLTYMDGFLLIAWVCAGMTILFACMKPIKNYFDVKEESALLRAMGKSTPPGAPHPAGSAA